MNEPASRDFEPFSVQHENFRNTLKTSDWDEFSKLPDNEQKIRFVYEKLYAKNISLSNDVRGNNNATSDGCKNGDKALEMKKSGTEYFQISDYRNALNRYSRAALHCPQTKGILL